jgi:hypothetical protein
MTGGRARRQAARSLSTLVWTASASYSEMPVASQVVQTRWMTTGVLRSPAVSYIQASTELSY